MPVGWAIAGSAVLGYVASENAADAASAAAAQSNATARDAAQLQYDLGKETLDFQKDYYQNTLKPMQERDLKLREDLQAELLPGLRQQREQSKEQYDYYKENYRPIEQQVAADAMGYDSNENVQRRMGIAAANVNQQFSNAQQQGARALARYGVNPNSSAFARENAKLMTGQALASAGAQTGAAFDTLDKGIALRAGAANFGRNMPNASATFGQVANQTAGVSSGVSSGGVNNAANAVSPLLQGSQIAAGAINSGGGITNDAFRNNMSMYNSQMQGVSGLFSGIGNIASTKWGQQGLTNMGNSVANWWDSSGFASNGGFGTGNAFGNQDYGMYFANGGEVDGPGGPRDDRIPAMLSDGEFVLNEGAVKHFGLSKLNKMNEIGLKNQQARGLIRRA